MLFREINIPLFLKYVSIALQSYLDWPVWYKYPLMDAKNESATLKKAQTEHWQNADQATALLQIVCSRYNHPREGGLWKSGTKLPHLRWGKWKWFVKALLGATVSCALLCLRNLETLLWSTPFAALYRFQMLTRTSFQLTALWWSYWEWELCIGALSAWKNNIPRRFVH